MAKAWSLPPSLLANVVREDVGRFTRSIAIQILNEVISRSPVGNPELWAINATAANYNREVNSYNADLRNDEANLTKAGRLRKGLKVNDSMDIKAPADYRPGLFRASNYVSVGAASSYQPTEPDKVGSKTYQDGVSTIQGAADFATIYIQSNLPYSLRLENGHSSQAPAGVYAQAFNSVVMKYRG
ncbi:putative neck protein [Erwinia phage Gungnir39]|nr:putative neck protein [Erwinia phage Gungnir39]